MQNEAAEKNPAAWLAEHFEYCFGWPDSEARSQIRADSLHADLLTNYFPGNDDLDTAILLAPSSSIVVGNRQGLA